MTISDEGGTFEKVRIGFVTKLKVGWGSLPGKMNEQPLEHVQSLFTVNDHPSG